MDGGMFAQTMPWPSSVSNYRGELMMASTRRRHPALVAIGSSCTVPRSAGDAGFSPSVSSFASTCGLLGCHGSRVAQRPASTKSFSAHQPFPCERRSTQKVASGTRDANLSQLVWEEQVARLQLRCREQERRIDLALSKPAQLAYCFRVPGRARASTLLNGARPHRFPAVAKGSVAQRHPVCDTARPLTGERGAEWSTRRAHRGKKNEKAGTPAGSCEATPRTLYVRDSDLLRALQRAEARIRELETRSLPSQDAGAERRMSSDFTCGREKCRNSAAPRLLAALSGDTSGHVSDPEPSGEAASYAYLCSNLVLM